MTRTHLLPRRRYSSSAGQPILFPQISCRQPDPIPGDLSTEHVRKWWQHAITSHLAAMSVVGTVSGVVRYAPQVTVPRYVRSFPFRCIYSPIPRHGRWPSRHLATRNVRFQKAPPAFDGSNRLTRRDPRVWRARISRAAREISSRHRWSFFPRINTERLSWCGKTGDK